MKPLAPTFRINGLCSLSDRAVGANTRQLTNSRGSFDWAKLTKRFSLVSTPKPDHSSTCYFSKDSGSRRLRAMSTETPVVVSNTVPSVVEAPMTDVAFVANPFDTDSIAAGLVTAATAEDQRSEFTASATSLVRLRPWKTAATLHQDLWRSFR